MEIAVDTRVEIRQVGQFSAIDADGNVYTVIENREFKRVRFLDNTWSNETPGTMTFQLEDGTPVHAMHDGTYRIDGSSVVLTKVPK
jgi:hypothetical protein